MKNKHCYWKTGCSKTRGLRISIQISIQIIYLNFWSAILFKELNPKISRCYAKKLCFFFSFFFLCRERSYTSQTNMSLSVKSWHGYGCNHGDWLVVRSPGESCSVGMCQTDRGARTHRRANQKPAVSLKTIGYIIETTYKFPGDSGRERKKGHFASSYKYI